MAAMALRERVFEAVANAAWYGAENLSPDQVDEVYRVADEVIAAITETDDGAASPGHGLGGSTPGLRPETSEVASGPAPSSLANEAVRSGPAGIGGQPGAASSTGDGVGAARASQDMPAPSSLPRSFQLIRHRDVTGVSGTGVIAEGTQWRDGTASLRWYGDHPSTVAWPSVDDVVAVHGHQGATELRWLDAPIELWPIDGDQP